MTLTEHPLFAKLKPFVRIELYSRDGGHKNPRFRISLRDREMDERLLLKAGLVQVHCVACGAVINPVRRSAGRTSYVYIAVTCPLALNIACSRNPAARDEYQRVRAAVEAP